jgi:hypothetical protein
MEENKQTEDNFSLENPEVDGVVTDKREDADDFFTNLDKEVNSLILDDNTSESEAPQVKQATSKEAPVEESDGTNLEKRYADSSREAKRLNQRLKELEPYAPLLDAYKNDPNLIQHTRDYFESGGQAPKTVKEKLNLGEDFVFDGDEAISDPKSDSAKVFGAVVDEAVSRRLSNYQRNQAVNAKRESDVNSFREKFDMTDTDYTELVDFAKSRSLTLEDIYYLKNRSERDMNVARATRDGMREQMQNVRQKPTSLSHTGSKQVDKSADDQIFDNILGIDNKLEEAFG